MNSADTIFALSSGAGRGGVAVIRVSGPTAGSCITQLTGLALPVARQAALRKLKDPEVGHLIDHALILWFEGPNSFTGEDVAEFHIHGGQAVTQAVLTALATVPGCRMAEAGEFTRRAFDHDKLDLTEAEAIADLIDATTAAQHRQAVRQLDGALGDLYHGWADQLVKTLAHLEAYLDFPDEPLPPELEAAHEALIQKITADITEHLELGLRGQRLRDGIRIAILGAPNAGKSSLLNALTTRDTAIVSSIAGTTRDVIESAIDIAGYPVILLDTAGLRDSTDPIEVEGVRRANLQADGADLIVLLYDASQPFPAELQSYLSKDNILLVANKSDLVIHIDNQAAIAICAKNGSAGIEPLYQRLSTWLNENYGLTDSPVLTRLRHKHQLEQTLQSLQRSRQAPSLDLVAEDLRLAVRALGEITGKVNVEDMLDIIFRDFCIGK